MNMTIASSYWSEWVIVPAYIIGAVIFVFILTHGLIIIDKNGHKRKSKYPNWVAYLMIAFAFCAVPAFINAWDEKRVIAAFLELLLAYAFYHGAIIGGIVAGGFVGFKVYERTDEKWLGWVVGILIALAVGFTVHVIGSKIPGIGRRMEKIYEKEKEKPVDDYIGRGGGIRPYRRPSARYNTVCTRTRRSIVILFLGNIESP